MQEDEILSVARFKLGDTARRLAVLADSASDAEVRTTLLELAAVLLLEQRDLDQSSRASRCARGRRVADRAERIV